MEAFFYRDDRLVVSPRPERSQRSFDFLVDLFDRFGIRKNTQKAVIIVCQP